MAQFLGIHEGIDTDPQQTGGDPWEDYKSACPKHDCTPLHVHFNTSSGRAFCVTEANSADDVRAAHEEANIPIKEVIEVEYAD